jgi:hypothetical protein
MIPMGIIDARLNESRDNTFRYLCFLTDDNSHISKFTINWTWSKVKERIKSECCYCFSCSYGKKKTSWTFCTISGKDLPRRKNTDSQHSRKTYVEPEPRLGSSGSGLVRLGLD